MKSVAKLFRVFWARSVSICVHLWLNGGSVIMPKSRIPVWLIAALLALVTLALYWPVTRCDFVNLDDPDATSPRMLRSRAA